MSRLTHHIEQKIAQRDSIDLAARRLAGRPGWVVEFGLGVGRSYTHLALRFPGREIFCFDRRDGAHPGCGPAADHLILGELTDVLGDPAVAARFRGRVVLAHLDLARGDLSDGWVHQLVLTRIHPWLVPGAWVLSDRPLALDPGWYLVPVPETPEVAHAERFFRYEHRPA